MTVAERAFDSDTSLVRPAVLSADLRGRSLLTLGDALGRAPGVLLQESFGGFEPPRISIRGSGLQSAPSSRGLSLLQDGLPLGLADGSFNSAFFDPRHAEKIEIERGLDAWRAPAVLGGVINLVSAQQPVPAATAEAGSFGAIRTHLAGSIHQTEAIVVSGNAGFEQQDGSRPHSAQQRTSALAKLRLKTAAGSSTDLSVLFLKPVYDVPGPLTLAVAEISPRTVSADVLRDQPRREAETWRAAINRSDLSDAVETGVAWQHTSDWFRQLQANGISRSISDDLSVRASAVHATKLAGMENRIRAGLTASRGWREMKRFTNVSGQTGALFGRDGLYATTAALTLEDTVKLLPGLTASAGYSRVYQRREIVDRFATETSTSRTDYRRSQSADLGRLKVQWRFSSTAEIFAGVSQAVEPPTFDDLLVVTGSYPNLRRSSQPLQQQRATTCELGTRGRLGPLEWDFTAYRSEWRNEILRLADSSGQPRGAVNASPTLHTGIETALHWKIYDQAQKLTLSATQVWSRFTFKNDPVYGNNRLAGAPPCVGSAELFYSHPCGLFAATGLDWTAGRTLVDHAGRMSYGSHTLANLRAGWQVGRMWTLFVDTRNLFDRRYIASTAGVLDRVRNPATTSVFLPGNGRSVTVGVELRK